jgi:hypothetical protein
VEFLATSLPPQSTFFIQLIVINTVLGLGMELLRVMAVVQAWLRVCIGPNLTESEKNRTRIGLRPFSDPRDFLHARIFASTVLLFMVTFTYTMLSPITCYVLTFSFLVLGAGYRHQFFYIYPPKDSGGRLWMRFIGIALACMFIAQLTLCGYLLLKESPVASGLIIPLMVFTVLFNQYIRQRHFRVARYLSSEDCLRFDMQNALRGSIDFEPMKGQYRQPEFKIEENELSGAADREEDIILSLRHRLGSRDLAV